MNCTKCGRQIRTKDIEGSDYIIDAKGKWWCYKCATATLSTARHYEELADEPGRYREGLVKALTMMIEDGFCVKPKERCEASADKCLKCWLNFLTGEMEE